MSKLRNPNSIEGAIQRVLGVLLDDGVEAATGKSARLVRQWSDPDDESHRIQLHQAIALDSAMLREGQPAAIIPVCLEMLRRVAAPAHAAADPMSRLAEVMAEVGDVAGEVRASVNPAGDKGRELSHSEKLRIAAEAQEAIDALLALQRDLEA